MKRKLITLFTFFLLLLDFSSAKVFASCGGVLTPGLNNWTATSNCTISNGLYSVWGVADINSRNITINSNAALIVDWKNDKMTFTTGKVEMSGNAVIYDAISGTYTSYNDTGTGIAHKWWRITNCATWTAWNPITRSNATARVNASYDGRLVCK